MLFNSFNFLLIFLPIVLVVGLWLKGQRLLGWITGTSFVFYAFAGHVWFLVPMLFTTVLDFFVAQRMQAARGRSRRHWLYLSLAGNLGLLMYFKYSRLFWPSVNVILPAGISFYTFQTLSYIIDVYRSECEAERGFLRFAGFVSFFPHLVAGPLTRHNQLIPALAGIARTGMKPRWSAGILLFAIGLCKKVLIADRIGNLIDPMLLDISSLGLLSSWAALLGYALQIYFDFSGYSDMAIGLGRLFGIELPLNFRNPYRAVNPSDFWTRWHITLSRWLRDYLYITLGGNRCSEARRSFNLMATMVLGGLWHGASWTFAAWGFYHGALLIAYHHSSRRWDRMPVAVQVGLNFILVCLGWVFFRAQTFHDAATWFGRLFGLYGLGLELLSRPHFELLVLVTLGLIFIRLVSEAYQKPEFDLEGLSAPIAVALGISAGGAILLMNFSSKFLYFQF